MALAFQLTFLSGGVSVLFRKKTELVAKMTSTMVGRNEWFSVQDIPTKILTWGDGVEELKCGQNLVVLIPGNPGISDFYEQFLAQLHENLRMPVWMISHAGEYFSFTFYSSKNVPEIIVRTCDNFASCTHRNFFVCLGHESPGILDKIHPGSKRLYDLADQVEHKRAVIEEFVPEGCRLYLIGHSVGAKITSELLRKPNVERKIEKCFMLFPTIERIGDTPNAKFIRPFVKYLGSVILILAWVRSFSFLHFFQPPCIKINNYRRGSWVILDFYQVAGNDAVRHVKHSLQISVWSSDRVRPSRSPEIDSTSSTGKCFLSCQGRNDQDKGTR